MSGASNKIFPLPSHVAIIMDGNGRWAEQQGRSRLYGHEVGAKNILDVVLAFSSYSIKFVTLYAFSTENWHRPEDEVKSLMEILSKSLETQASMLHKKGVRIKHLGRSDRIDKSIYASIKKIVKLTRNNKSITLSIAFDYGGRDEILHAIKEIIKKDVDSSELTEDTIKNFLYTRGIPDPDLIIRTAGEMRISNFFLWQSAYSEYYATNTLWPDFGKRDISGALEAYCKRHRNFGTIRS